jgi:hypothetical protein
LLHKDNKAPGNIYFRIQIKIHRAFYKLDDNNKRILKKQDMRVSTDSSGSGQVPVVGSYEYNKEPSNSTEGEKSLTS